MTPERYARIGALFHDALERPAEQRAAFLDAACEGDDALRQEVASLLAAHDSDRAFIETPAMATVAAQLAADHRPLVPGTAVGPYEVRTLLGRGGMGEVYRAHDARLGRDVALKLLPSLFSLDAQRLARFGREARHLAALSHPNIAALYGLEEWNGQRILVLELVEGWTLEDRLLSGPVALPEAIGIALQIVDALETAHEHGIVHRDLKPANIAIRPDGLVKVLDFGLAKGFDPSASRDAAVSVTDVTDPQTVIGTAPYMSPEQTRGTAGDQRIDIWAFGCVFYEMLTGRRAFDGETRSDVMAAVIERSPDWAALPPGTPALIRRLLKRCLDKDPRDRLRDIADARFDLREALSEEPVPATPPPTRSPSIAALTAGIAVVMTGAAGWLVARPPADPPRPVTRFSITAPTGPSLAGRSLAISPDGSRLAYLAIRAGQVEPLALVIRARDRLEPAELSLPAFALAPFFSPDSAWVGYSDGRALYKVPVTGGTPVFIAEVAAAASPSWTRDGIVFADARGMFRISREGSPPEPLPMPPLEGTERAAYPILLPGGRAVVFTVVPAIGPRGVGGSTGMPGTRIDALDLETGARTTLVRGGSRAQYVPTGHLVYTEGESLYAAPFDPKALTMLGAPVQIVSDVSFGEFAVADDGTLVYMTGGLWGLTTVVWVDRQGREEALDAPPRRYVYPRLSPDGSRIALDDAGPPDRDIWIWDLRRHALERFTVDPTGNPIPAWSPDGTRIAFGSERFGRSQLFLQPSDRSSDPQRLLESDRLQMPITFAPDGRLLYSEAVPDRGRDIHLLSLDGSRRVQRLVHSAGDDATADVSPDNRWLAYDSDESGQFEVYVRPYPDADRARWQVSILGGRQPLWSKDGRELFYRDFSGAVMSVPVVLDPGFSAGAPRKVIDGAAYFGEGRFMTGRTYDVSRDGRRFLMLKRLTSGASLVVVLNWAEELTTRVPTR